MDPSTSVVGLDAQGNMLFRVMKPVMGLFQVSSEQANSGVDLQGLSDTSLVLTQAQGQALLVHSEGMMAAPQPQILRNQMESQVLQVQAPAAPTLDPPQSEEPPQSQCSNGNPSDPSEVTRMPFAEVSSLLDPNMKGSKARKYLISYEEIKRRLQSPEKMSLRSLAAYTRVSRGPASKKTLLESLNILGLKPSTTTSVSSSFSKLTEGDTNALCVDMKDFAQDYVDYGNMAKQLIPETNTVQHWSKIIETKNHLDDMRKCFRDPVNSKGFDSVTHGLGLGMLDVALDMVTMAIDQQVHILSGAAASDPPDSGPPARRIRRRNRKPCTGNGEKPPPRAPGAAKGVSKGRGRGRGRKKARLAEPPAMETVEVMEASAQQDAQNGVLTLVSVGYETISGGLDATGSI
ncbi:unnamed protein product [Lota lota]